MLNFFLNITSRPVALAGLLVVALTLHNALVCRGWMPRFFLFLAVALSTALSPVLGLSAVFSLTVGLGGAVLLPRMDRNGAQADTFMRPVVAAAVMIFGALVSSPTYYHLVFGPSTNQMQIWMTWVLSPAGIRHAITTAMSVVPLVVLAYLGWKKSTALNRKYLFTLMFAGLVLLGLCVTVLLPAGNSSNFFHAAVILLAVPASAFILNIDETGQKSTVNIRKLVGLGLFFLPTTLLLLGSYVQRPDVPVSFSGRHISRTPPESDLAMLYGWIRAETANNAIFVFNPNPPHVRICGNSSEFPAMIGRAIFTEELKHYLVKPYPRAEFRVDLAVKLSAGEPVTVNELQYLTDLKRPIYLLIFDEQAQGLADRLRLENGLPVFHLSNTAVYRVRTTE